MAEQFVTGETLVGEVVSKYPEAIEILLSIGMHCLGCPASRAESLEDACAVHGIPAEQVIDAINEKISAIAEGMDKIDRESAIWVEPCSHASQSNCWGHGFLYAPKYLNIPRR